MGKILTISILEILVLLVSVLALKVESTIWFLAILFGIVLTIYVGVKNENLKKKLSELFASSRKFAITIGVILIFVFPLFFTDSPYWIFVITIGVIYIILAIGLNMMLGSLDLVNLGFAAFFGIGAYTVGMLTAKYGLHIPYLIVFLLAGLVAMIFGLLLCLPTMGMKGYYFSLTTIAFGLAVELTINNLEWTGGPGGIKNIPHISLFGLDLGNSYTLFGYDLPFQINYFYFALIVMLLVMFVAWLIHNSRIGLAWNAIKEDDIAARAQGINIKIYRIYAFALGSFIAGMAGAIFAPLMGYIAPTNFTYAHSITMVAMVILGGIDNIVGIALGAFLLSIAPEKFRAFADYRMLIYALIIILMVIYRPQGLIPKKIRKYDFIGGAKDE